MASIVSARGVVQVGLLLQLPLDAPSHGAQCVRGRVQCLVRRADLLAKAALGGFVIGASRCNLGRTCRPLFFSQLLGQRLSAPAQLFTLAQCIE